VGSHSYTALRAPPLLEQYNRLSKITSMKSNSSLREGVYLYTMTPSRIANKLRVECSYHTPIRVVLSTKKLGKHLWMPRLNPPIYIVNVEGGPWANMEAECSEMWAWVKG
jgi:hypothetical protein